ncbi:hypothetical protein SpCBS45565_g03414 [Spizellomyces sp. 'palustris']|nr:hypothetical protein SpCBS45565_g03414 [Spizellomyces sp. 'palustris']
MATFKAAQFTSYGGPDKIVISDLPIPTADEPDSVLIKVHAASLNPIDWKRAEGMMKMLVKESFPLRTGYDVSGVVSSVGSGVTKFKVGDEVFGRIGQAEVGTVAEYVLSTEAKLALKPKSLTHVQAAGVPLTGLTAYQVLEKSNFASKPSRKIFIPAGAGGIGVMAIQLAKHLFNAETIATTVSEAKIDIVKDLGADVVVDYKKEDYTQVLKDYDMAIDTTGETKQQFAILKPGGTLYSIAALPNSEEANAVFPVGFFMGKVLDVLTYKLRWAANSKNIDYHYLFMSPNGTQLAEIGNLADQGKLKVLVDSTFPFTLEGVRDAFARQKQGRATGKVIIQVI